MKEQVEIIKNSVHGLSLLQHLVLVGGWLQSLILLSMKYFPYDENVVPEIPGIKLLKKAMCGHSIGQIYNWLTAL